MNFSDINNAQITDEKTSSTKYLITNTNFEKIKQLQQEIQDATDVYPSLRKIINLLINDDAIYTIKQQLLNQLR